MRDVTSMPMFELGLAAVLVAGLIGTVRAEPEPATAKERVVEQSVAGVANSFLWHRPQDEIWLLSTRSLASCCHPSQEFTPDVRRFQGANGWQSDSLHSLCAAPHGAGLLNVIYVHGNRAEWNDAFERGFAIYQALTCQNLSECRIRFLIWSWPSDQLRGVLHDVRAKAERTDAEVVFLSKFLAQLPADAATSLIGYSFGARIICGALQTLSATSTNQTQVSESPPMMPAQRPLRIVLIAAAINSDWVLPGCYFGNALPQVDRGLVVFNSEDPVLKRYSLIERGHRNGVHALGYTGITGGLDHVTASRIRQLNACSAIGKTHDELRYLGSPDIVDQMRRYATWAIVD